MISKKELNKLMNKITEDIYCDMVKGTLPRLPITFSFSIDEDTIMEIKTRPKNIETKILKGGG